MTRQDAIRRIAAILVKAIKMEQSRAEHVAERIYVDVFAPAVDDERSLWMDMARRHELLDS